MPADAGRPPAEPAPGTRPAEAAPRSVAEILLDGCDEGVVVSDPHGVVVTANTAARRMLPQVRVGELLAAAGLAVLATPGAQGDRPEVELQVGDRALVARHRPLPGAAAAWHLHDVTEQRARLDSLLAERARARFLATAGRRLGLSLHPGRTARAIAELAADLADEAVVVRVGSGGIEWTLGRRGAPLRSGTTTRDAVPEPLLDALRGLEPGPRPLLPDHVGALPWTGGPGEAVAAAVVALPGNGTPAGALVLLRRDPGAAPGPLGDVDEALVEEFAQRAGIALAAAGLYAQQARTVAVLEQSLVQPALPGVEGMAFGAVYRPAEGGLLIGGDFHDVLPDADGAMFLLGDVCGKGVDAAVSTGQLRQSVRALRRLEPDPVRLLDLLNATMLEAQDDAHPRFATLVLGTAQPLPGSGLRLVLAGGGHLPPLLVRRDGLVEAVEIDGMLVGALPAARFGARTVDLAPGEACVLYTDGVTEARGGLDGRQMFGEERLADVLAGCHVLPAPGIAERIALHTSRWLRQGHHDDIAVLVVQAPLPVVPRPAPGRHLHAVRPTDEELS